jgi:hypothetical protein
MIDNVDIERYELAYSTVVKCNFNEPNQLAILSRWPLYFSNLRETESGVVIAGLNGSVGADSANNDDEDGAVDVQANAGASGNVSDNTDNSSSNNNSKSNSSSSYLTDGYGVCSSLARVRTLIQTAINEYNKENQRIEMPLYESTLMLVCRLCHAAQCSNCCIIADGGMSPFLMPLVATLIQFNLINFKSSQFMCAKEMLYEQLRHKLVSSYYRAGIKVTDRSFVLSFIVLFLLLLLNKNFKYLNMIIITEGRENYHLFERRRDERKRVCGIFDRVSCWRRSNASIHHRRGDRHIEFCKKSSASGRLCIHERDRVGVFHQVNYCIKLLGCLNLCSIE